MEGGTGLSMAEEGLGCDGRLVGLAVILGIGDGLIFGGLGDEVGPGIGPAITFGGAAFGTGAGMYGCLRPPESEIAGTFLVVVEGVRIPLVSLMSWGLSSQLEAETFGVDV
jgi:hypothetical protein